MDAAAIRGAIGCHGRDCAVQTPTGYGPSAQRFVQAAGRFDKFQVAYRTLSRCMASSGYLTRICRMWLSEADGCVSRTPQHGRSCLDAKVKRVTAKGFEGVDMKLLLQPDSPLGQVEPGGWLGADRGPVNSSIQRFSSDESPSAINNSFGSSRASCPRGWSAPARHRIH